MNSRTLITISVLGAFLLWGFWAFYVNYQADNLTSALRTGLVQGIYSGAMTLYMSLAVVFFIHRTQHWPMPTLWPTLFTVGHTGLLLTLVHVINHTQHIVKTIAAPLIVSVVYCFLVTKNHSKKAPKE